MSSKKAKKTKRSKRVEERTMMTEDGEEVSMEEVVAVQSLMIKDLMEAYQLAGKAINRLETFTFSLVKVVLDSNLISYAELSSHCRCLSETETLEEFWGVSMGKDIEGSDSTDGGEGVES